MTPKGSQQGLNTKKHVQCTQFIFKLENGFMLQCLCNKTF